MMRLAFILPSVLAVGPCSYTTKDGKLTYSLDAVSLKTAACVTRACFAPKGEARANELHRVCCEAQEKAHHNGLLLYRALDSPRCALLFPCPPLPAPTHRLAPLLPIPHPHDVVTARSMRSRIL